MNVDAAESIIREPQITKRWLFLAVAAIGLAGLFALVPLIGRVPGIKGVVDPDFGGRFLVFHVTLAFQVWFYAFLATLFSTLPYRRPAKWWVRIAPAVCATGVVLLLGLVLVSAFFPDPPAALKSHYILSLNHPLWLVGLGIVGLGVTLSFIRFPRASSLLEGGKEQSSESPVRYAAIAAAIGFVLGMLTVAVTGLGHSFPEGLSLFGSAADEESRRLLTESYTLLFWGAGHVLQFSNIAAMIAVWFMLSSKLEVRNIVSQKTSIALLSLQLLPALIGVVIAIGYPSGSSEFYTGFRVLMTWGTWPILLVLVVVFLSRFSALFSEKVQDTEYESFNPNRTGLISSLALAISGCVLGVFVAVINEESTLIPGHYHAALGGVTIAFCAAVFEFMKYLGMPIPTPKLRKIAGLQPLVFGGGQLVMAIGLAVAGGYRKTYSSEQVEVGTKQVVGYLLMGAGGLVAVVGGVMFLIVIVRSWRKTPLESTARGA